LAIVSRFTLQRRFLLSFGALLVPLAVWVWLLAQPKPLPGLRIGGQPLLDDQPLERTLRERAAAWAATEITITTRESRVRATRAELGARLEVAAVLAQARALGHSGNPLTDLRKTWAARRGELDVSWFPVTDQTLLSAFVERQRERVELPPKVGISDGQGWSLPGEDGVTLAFGDALAMLNRALRSGALQVELPLSLLAAPEAIVIGSPDGVLFDDSPSPATSEPQPSVASLAPVPGIEWQPSRGDECVDDPIRMRYCQGPRMVPKPFGPDAALADTLGLGSISAVGTLLVRGPPARWVAAGGMPSTQAHLQWPVPSAHFVRGFGYVRKSPELRDKLHRGVDIAARLGTPILATNAGIVAYADNGVRGYGNLLVIVHVDGSFTLSAHCSRILVFAGQRVERGQHVADVGSTGMSSGPHLHFEVHLGAEPRDPRPYFAREDLMRAGWNEG
jgi:Peptidase family M23